MRMKLQLASRAAYNNAAWCDAVCRAQGAATRLSDGIWVNDGPSPPFYPNVVTLDPLLEASSIIGVIERLRRTGRHFGIKDSFCCMDLASSGFKFLFRAEWLWRTPRPVQAKPQMLQWKSVDDVAELLNWEAAWWPEPDRACEPGSIFGAGLLSDPAIKLIAGYEGRRLVAGVACTFSADVVGMCCLFLPPHRTDELLGELVSEVAARFPGTPLVRYASGAEQEALCALGFSPAGPLRVWLSA